MTIKSRGVGGKDGSPGKGDKPLSYGAIVF
jgi:hypothetical protein